MNNGTQRKRKRSNGTSWEYLTNNSNIRTMNKNSLGNRIGAGAYGVVYQLPNPAFVMKRMNITNSRIRNSFMKEIEVGNMPGIGNVSPKIHAWRIVGNYGEFIMNSFTKGNSTLASLTLKDYLKTQYPTGAPGSGARLWRLIRYALVRYWEITGGMHGDLKSDNMAVVFAKDSPGQIQRILIFDHGSQHRIGMTEPQSNKLSPNENRMKILRRFRYFIKKFKNQTVHRTNGQPVIPNVNRLSTLTPYAEFVNQIDPMKKRSLLSVLRTHVPNYTRRPQTTSYGLRSRKLQRYPV